MANAPRLGSPTLIDVLSYQVMRFVDESISASRMVRSIEFFDTRSQLVLMYKFERSIGPALDLHWEAKRGIMSIE